MVFTVVFGSKARKIASFASDPLTMTATDSESATLAEPESEPTTVEPRLDATEVIRRLPEVRTITNERLRALTIDALRYTPDYWWNVPASTSGKYHNPLARGKHGLWIHTKMAMTALEVLLPSWKAQGKLTEWDADCARAAVLLHDIFKQGLPENRDPSDPNDCHTVGNHDVIAAEWLAAHTELPAEVIGAVEAHNGPEEWGEGKSPDSDLEQIVHMADNLASEEDGTFGVWKPSDRLTTAYPDIPRSDLR